MKNNTLFYINFCIQVFSITSNPNLRALMLQLCKSSFETSLILLSDSKLSSRRIYKVWLKPISTIWNSGYSGLLGEKLPLLIKTPYFIDAGQSVAVYSNYNNLRYLKTVNILSLNLHLQYLFYFSNWYSKCLISLADFSLAIIHYLIRSRSLTNTAIKPINRAKSLFLVNLKKL